MYVTLTKGGDSMRVPDATVAHWTDKGWATEPAPEPVPSEPGYDGMTVKALRALAESRDLATYGKKADLVRRLTEADTTPATNLNEFQEEHND